MNYYNEIDPFAAEWMRNLIKAGHIAPGDVDTRSIEDVTPADLRGYVQCHFFAGIGVWSYALRRAGWPDDRPVWTGSCPCQPFSSAGKGVGFDDERHLWPAFYHLISQCRPPVVFGEQVASKDGLAWLDLVQVDLEAARYATAAADLCAAGVGAPHIRQRLYWVADAVLLGQQGDRGKWDDPAIKRRMDIGKSIELSMLVHVAGWPTPVSHNAKQMGYPAEWTRNTIQLGTLAHLTGWPTPTAQDGSRGNGTIRPQDTGIPLPQRVMMIDRGQTRPTNGHWRDADWLYCRDGKWRPVEPGTFPLAHGAASRVGRLRAYGNAIVPQVAETFIRAYLEC